jgi:hypothetical protein
MADPKKNPKDDTTTTSPELADAITTAQAQITDLQKQHEHTAFANKLCDTITESDSLKAVIKGLVWQTVKDKIVWLIIGAVVFLVIIFAKEYIGQLAGYAARASFGNQTQQRNTPAFNSP